MTYAEAIKIQDEQIIWYGKHYLGGESALRTDVKAKTLPCTFNPNEQRSVIEINRLVPRGGSIEHMCGLS